MLKNKDNKRALNVSFTHNKWEFLLICLYVVVLLLPVTADGQTPQSTNSRWLTSGTSWSFPEGLYQITKIEAIGGGGGGGSADGSDHACGGGGGGGYACYSHTWERSDVTSVTYSIGSSGNACQNGGNSTVSVNGSSTITAYGGKGVSKNSSSGSSGGSYTGPSGTTGYNGGKGGNGSYKNASHNVGGAGGGGAGAGGAGGNGENGNIYSCGTWNLGTCVNHPQGGSGGSDGGGKGGSPRRVDSGSGDTPDATSGSSYGGGGGGSTHESSITGGTNPGGSGAKGAVRISYKTLQLTVGFDKVTTGTATVTGMPSTQNIWYYANYNTIRTTTPSQSGYTFKGWFFDQACTQPYADGTCTRTSNFTLYAKFARNLTPGAITSGSSTICKGATASTINNVTNASSELGTVSYQWQVSTNGGSYSNISGATSASYTPATTYTNAGGTYKFRRMASDGSSSAYSNEYTLTVNAPAVTLNEISASATTVCSGSSVTLTASTSSNTGTVTYKWSANNSTDNPLTVNPTAQTTYTVTATATVGSCTATATKSKTVNVYPDFSAGAIASTGETICKNGTPSAIGSTTAASGGNGTITYKWQVSTNGGSYTDINNSNSATFNPSSYSNGGTYTFKRLAKDGACNDWTAASNTYTLTVKAPAVTLNDISASASTVCKGSDVTLTASTSSSTGTVTYKWSANNSTANPLSVNPTAQTTYTVTATATDGSCTVTDTKSKTINVYPDFSAGAISSTGQTICKDATPNAIGSTTAATGGNGSITYKWQVSTNGGSYTDIASSNSATFTPSAYKGTGGTYTFKRLAKDGACQTDWAAASNTYTLTVNAPAVTLNEISASASTVCSGSSVTLTASTSSNTGTVTYKWSANNSTDNPLTVNPTAQTTYTVTATATVGSCTATATKSKTVNVYPTFSAGAISSTGEEISVGETASEIGSTTAATGGNGSISYQWFAEESLIEGATSASYTPGETYTGVPGTYTFTRKAKDGACADWTLSENSYVLTVTNSIFEAVTDRGNIAACETVESNESFIDQNGQKVNRPAMSQYGELLNSSECEIQNYIISFDNNNGQDSMSAVSVGKGTSITLPSNTLTRTNCTFKEWNTERSGCGTVVADGATFATDSNVTLYAQWHSYCPGAAHTSINESGNASRIDSVKDHQNNWYEVVQVGTQCWLKENMRCTTSPKTLNTLVVMDKSESNHLPKAYYYDNDNSSVRPNGLLYNWYAAVDSSFESLPTETVDFLNRRGICPEGWHVPSNEDWNVLEDYLVGSPISRDLSSDISLYGQSSLNAIAGGCRWAEETNPEGPGYYDGSKRNSTGLSIVPTGYFCENTFHFLNEYMGVEADESLIMTGFQAATYVKEPSLGVVTRMIGCGDMLSFLSLATIGIVHANDGDGADGYCVRCIRNDVTIGAVTKTDSTINSLTIRTAFTANKAVTSGTVCAYTDASCTTPVGTCATIAANASSPVTATITGLAHNSKYYVKVTVNTANGTDSKIAGPFGTKPIIDTISFVPDGGTGTMTTQSVVRGVATPIKANAYSHTNWQFLGWNDACDGKGTNYANQANITTNGNVTLYAQWHSWCTGTPYSSNERGNSRIDSVKDHQNNWYKVVQIGNQCWLKENMRCTTSPSGKNMITSNSLSYIAPFYYNYSAENPLSLRERGLLYNWVAAMDTIYENPTSLPEAKNFPNHRAFVPWGGISQRMPSGI